MPEHGVPGPYVSRGPELPAGFSGEGMRRRRGELDAVLEQADLRHVLVHGAKRAGRAVQWLTGWPVTREALVVHGVGEADTLLVQFYNRLPEARRVASDADVRWAGPRTGASALEELRRRGVSGPARIGAIGALPFQTAGALAGEGLTLVDLNPAYTRLRLRKAAEELDWLCRAAELTDLSCAALQRPAAVDSTESSWPPWSRAATSCGVDYPGQLLRTFTVGAEPTPLVRELHAVADEALSRIEALLAPGVGAEEVVQAASVIEDAGFTTVDDLVHGLGGGYLPPVFDSRSRTLEPLPELRFAEGMTVVVQPNVTTPDRRAGVQTGELLLITAAGCERPAPVPRGLVRIAETRPAIGNVRERRLEEE